MVANLTAEIFSAFVYGVAAMIAGGLLFEGGKRYVKTAGSNQFKGKVEALPFFFGALTLGWTLQQLEPLVTGVVYSIPATTRMGVMVVGTMLLFNHSVDYFTYTDPKSLIVYAVGFLLVVGPSM